MIAHVCDICGNPATIRMNLTAGDDNTFYCQDCYSDWKEDASGDFEAPDLTCEHCHGTGVYWDGPGCPYCDDEGYYWWLS